MRTESNEIDMERTIHKINQKMQFCEKVNKIDIVLLKPTKNSEKTQINTNKGKKQIITTDSNEIQKIIREFSENLYSKGQEDIEEINQFLNAYNLAQFTL